jgi:trehalose 2-sulfotransferase
MVSKRPDLIDLIGADFDRPSPKPARRTLVICSAPRTGSYELCRHLVAAGIGVPHEYFNPNYARCLAERWAFTGDPLGESGLPRYMEMLRRRRVQSGVFATKLQFLQFDRYLRNRSGAALFEGACFVHLFRPDVATQYASLRAAVESGTWDFSPRQTTPPRARQSENSGNLIQEALNEITLLISEDAGFRGLFILLNIRPLFVTTDELGRDARSLVRRIGDAMAISVNEDALERSIASSAPYGREQQRQKAIAGLAESFRKIAFEKRTQSDRR